MKVSFSVCAPVFAVLCAANVTVAGAAPLITPSPAFAAYQDLCLNTAGDPAQVLTLAHNAGWIIPPQAELLPLGALSMNDGQQFERKIGSQALHLAVGHATDPAQLGAGASSWRVCVVSGEPGEPGAGAELARWAQVAPTHDSDAAGGSLLFLITGGPGARTSADGLSDAAIKGLVATQNITAVGARTAGPLTILLYAAPER